MIPAALFTLAALAPVLVAWRVGTRSIDAHDYELRTPHTAELTEARAAQVLWGESSRGAGRPANDNGETRSERVKARAA